MSKVHLIGNAHLDPVWLWRWPEGCAEALATFRSALDRMNEFPEYVFTCACAAYYEWVERIAPDMFEEIRRRVEQGRWVIAGGWWIQPDCNAPGGESFARHSLYAQRYFMNRFGKRAKVGYNVDSFGHSAMLPQILKLSGMDAYVYMRPGEGAEKRYPFESNAFWWESPDGSRVLTYRIPDGYGSGAFDGVAEKARGQLARAEAQGANQMCFYGVGNHGGGPTVENLKALEALRAESDEYAYSSPEAYFASLDADSLPVLRDELQHHASGCYSSVMEIKRLARKAEHRLLAAEAFGVLARALDVSGRPESLEPAWRKLLFNQFHDVMGGCSIRPACEDARDQLGEALSRASDALNQAAQAIAWNIDTLHGGADAGGKHDFRLWEDGLRGAPIHVFNPNSWDAVLPVDAGADAQWVTDETGAIQPSQRVRSQVTFWSEGGWNRQTRFLARVPALGWRTYYLHAKSARAAKPQGTLSCGETFLENDFLRAEFDPLSGALTRLLDKRSGRDCLSAPSRALVIDETKSDTWAHAVFAFRAVVGAFGSATLALEEEGDLCATLLVKTSYGKSEMEQRFTLYRELPELRVRAKVFWREEHKLLKLAFPTKLRTGRSVAGIAYGELERPMNGDEQPMQSWAALREGERSFALATDSLAAFDALEGEIRLTALRSPLSADHTFGRHPREAGGEFTEQGEHRFELALMPDAVESASRRAAELSQGALFLPGTWHAGRLPECSRGVDLGAENVEMTALKPGEDGDALILRLRETQGREATAHVTLPALGKAWETKLTPYQIRSFRIADGEICEVNLLEEHV